jgi:hypothetical protein
VPREDTQFKPGNPGGPGRPKGRSISEELKAILGEHSLNDRPRKDGKLISRQMAEELAKKALGRRSNASLQAIDMVMDRTEGKVPQAIQLPTQDLESAREKLRQNRANVANAPHPEPASDE